VVTALAAYDPTRTRDSSDTRAAARVEAMVLHAVFAEHAGDEHEARALMEQALEYAEPELIRRPFLDAGPTAAVLLRRTIRAGTAHRWLAGVLLAAIESGGAAAELREPLSGRERVVLRYLPTMMSNREIANELFVSVNTVKTHLKNIYRKLETSNRRQTVQRARELGLIG
jgi:LuxR family transcriptional regulator, maltose regulon positive regulatory protein